MEQQQHNKFVDSISSTPGREDERANQASASMSEEVDQHVLRR